MFVIFLDDDDDGGGCFLQLLRSSGACASTSAQSRAAASPPGREGVLQWTHCKLRVQSETWPLSRPLLTVSENRPFAITPGSVRQSPRTKSGIPRKSGISRKSKNSVRIRDFPEKLPPLAISLIRGRVRDSTGHVSEDRHCGPGSR